VARDSASPMAMPRTAVPDVAPPRSASDARSAFDRLFKK
jgi:hypothetical protein